MEGVDPITIDDLGRMGIGLKNELYWDGKEVQVQNNIVFGFWELFFVGITAISSGIMAAVSIFNYRREKQ